jgi:hypothetical protein
MTLADDATAALAAVEDARAALATIESKTSADPVMPGTNIRAAIGRARDELNGLEALFRKVKAAAS